jgi:hypothetical protein
MTDSEFLEAFECCTLTREQWTHDAHVRVAWLYLGLLPYEYAVQAIRSGIQRLNERVLKKDMAYHETITVAYARLIASVRNGLPASHGLDSVKQVAPALFDRELSALLKHYSRERLFSAEARACWVNPDLNPLP